MPGSGVLMMAGDWLAVRAAVVAASAHFRCGSRAGKDCKCSGASSCAGSVQAKPEAADDGVRPLRKWRACPATVRAAWCAFAQARWWVIVGS